MVLDGLIDLFFFSACLITNGARGFASRLATCLAFATADFMVFAKRFLGYYFDMLHKEPPKIVLLLILYIPN